MVDLLSSLSLSTRGFDSQHDFVKRGKINHSFSRAVEKGGDWRGYVRGGSFSCIVVNQRHVPGSLKEATQRKRETERFFLVNHIETKRGGKESPRTRAESSRKTQHSLSFPLHIEKDSASPLFRIPVHRDKRPHLDR